MTSHLLSWITFFPLIGMVVVLFLPRDRHNWIRWTSAAASAVTLALSIWLFGN
ncbi:MAG: NADH-quinone oxidoreductase subunit M, partial [Candidatus Eisenbacteria bacterium]|nr:NADH-quinone oxidoreductase subunit M [Candidatus Eisenbacteria bacterium]